MNEIMELEKKEINKKNKDLKTEDESSHEIWSNKQAAGLSLAPLSPPVPSGREKLLNDR